MGGHIQHGSHSGSTGGQGLRPANYLECGLFATAEICLEMNLILTFTGELLIDRPGRIESTAWPAEVRALTPSPTAS